MNDLTSFLNFILILLGYLSIFIFLSWILSFIRSPIFSILDKSNIALIDQSNKLFQKFKALIANYISPIWISFKNDLSKQKQNRFMSSINNLIDNTDNIGQQQINIIESLADNIHNVNTLQFNPPENMNESQSLLNKFKEKTIDLEPSKSSLLWFLGGLSVIVLLLNLFLLRMFFAEIFGLDIPIIRQPLRIELAHIIAFLFGVIEFGLGVLYYQFSHGVKDEEEFLLTRRWRISILFFVLIFAGIEFIVFSIISVQINLSNLLDISADNSVYKIVRYFLGFFGIAITFVQFFLGHLFWKTIDYRINYKKKVTDIEKINSERDKYLAAVNDMSNKLQKIVNQKDYLTTLADKVKGFKQSVSESFRSIFGIASSRDIPVADIKSDRLQDIKAHLINNKINNEKPIVSGNEAFQFIVLYFFFFVIWFVLLIVTASVYQTILEGLGIGYLGFKLWKLSALSILFSLSITYLGYQTKKHWLGERYLEDAEIENTGSSKLTIILIIVILLLSFVLFVIYGLSKQDAMDLPLSISLGIILPLSLFFISIFIENYFTSLAICTRVAGITLALIAILGLPSLIMIMCFIILISIKFIFDIIMIPGFVIRKKN